jgi:type IV secretory pathway TrbF-like protein
MKQHQQGMSLLGVLLLAAVIAFFAYAAVKLVPLYIENFGVSSSLKTLNEEEIQGVDSGELRTRLLKRLEINNVRSVKPDNIKIRSEGNFRIVTVDYEVRTRFYGNVYLLVAFSDRVVLPGA